MDNNNYQRRAAEAAERTAIAAEQKEERARQIWRALKYGGLSGLSIFIIGMVDYVVLVSANNIFERSSRVDPLGAFFAIIISVVGLAITTARIGPKLDLRISGGLYGIAGGIFGLFLIFLFVIMHDESEMWQSIPVWSLILAICITSIIISIIAIKPNQPSTTNIQEFGSVLTTGRGLVLDQFRSWFASKPTPVGPDEILIAAPTGKRNVIRWVMTALGILYGLNFAISQSRIYEADRGFSLLAKKVDKADAFAEAGHIGNLTLIIALAIPVALWALVNHWKPITRKGYAFRFGLWPTVFLSSFFGGPIACSIMGTTQRVQSFYGAFQATLVLSLLGGATFILIGYWIGNGIGSVQKKPVLNLANDLPRFAFNPNQKITTNTSWNGRLKKFGIFLAVTVVCVVSGKYLGRQQAREAAARLLTQEQSPPLASTSHVDPLPAKEAANVLASKAADPFPAGYPRVLPWVCEKDGCVATFPTEPRRVEAEVSGGSGHAYQSYFQFSNDLVALAQVSIVLLTETFSGSAAENILTLNHNEYVQTIGATPADSRTSRGTFGDAKPTLEFEVRFSFDDVPMISKGFWLLDGTRIMKVSCVYPAALTNADVEIVQHFPKTFALFGRPQTRRTNP